MPGLTSRAVGGRRGAALWNRAVRLGTRRPVATAAAIYLLLAIVMFAPGLAPGRVLSASDHLWTAAPWEASRPAGVPLLGSNREMVDSVTQFQPAQQETREALPDIPLWNPDVLSGRPFLGDPQTAIFSPFSVPTYVLPFWKSLAIMSILKLFVGALGGFLMARELRLRYGGALLTGLVFGFSLWSVTWVSWTLASVWAFLPWLCFLSERCVRRPGAWPVAGLALVVALQWFGGHPSSSVQILAVVALAWGVRVLAAPTLRAGVGRRLLALGGGITLGTALAAVMLVPFAELLLNSADLKIRTGASELLHQPPDRLLALFLHDWWGSGDTGLSLSFSLEHAYYVAALPLMLAASALLLRPRRERIAVAALALAMLAIVSGLPPLYDLVIELPGLRAANNGRFAVVAVLCLALLAGWGLDDLTGRPLGRARRRAVVGAGAVLLAFPAVLVVGRGMVDLDALGAALEVAWGFATPTAALAGPGAGGLEGVVRLASLLEWLVLAALALGLLALRVRGRLGATGFVALALVLVTLDLFKAGMGFNPAIPESTAAQPVTPALRYLQAQRPARFTALAPARSNALVLPLPPNVAMRYGLHDARGYAQPTEERYFELWRQAISTDGGCYYFFCTVLADSSPRALRGLGLLGVSDLLQSPADPDLRGLSVAYSGRDARIYRNPSALPRAFVVDRQVVVDNGDEALDTAVAAGFPVRSAVVTERRIAGLSEGRGTPARVAGTARVTDDGRERVVVDTRADRATMLVLTDPWFPGWKATVDGESAPVERVDYVIRGVRVPAGSHRVEFRYEPASVRIGWVTSALALAAILLLVLSGLRSRRASSATAPSTISATSAGARNRRMP
jgi:hypothetical protein